jgi:hypothetical protein
MQRIDENTYIDDTLVTCAEYQLFIDEMREQGKYYQPDHWISYQFPEGQAREPVTGVRPSDAQTFCRWLTRREGGVWKYRLPSQKEAKDFPVKPQDQCLLGYWVIGNYQFAWVGQVPKDARRVDVYGLERTIMPSMTRALNRARNRALKLEKIDNSVISDTLYFARDLDYTRQLAEKRGIGIDGDLDLSEIIGLILKQIRGIGILSDRDDDLDVFVDLYTLQERVAGRSPAFEGIRLVKERIR